jgi:hypothetical protein
MSRSQNFGGLVNSRANTMIRIAAADIAAQRIIYIVVGRLSVCIQKGDRRHDLARLAVAALGHIEFCPGRLNDFRDLSGYALDGYDTAIDNFGDSRLAGPYRLTIDENGACSAKSLAAAVLGTGQTEIVPQDPKQRLGRINIKIPRLAIQGNSHRGSSPFN